MATVNNDAAEKWLYCSSSGIWQVFKENGLGKLEEKSVFGEAAYNLQKYNLWKSKWPGLQVETASFYGITKLKGWKLLPYVC